MCYTFLSCICWAYTVYNYCLHLSTRKIFLSLGGNNDRCHLGEYMKKIDEKKEEHGIKRK
jgi:hypothetical protein